MRTLERAVSVIERAAGVIAGLLPEPRSNEAERPDVDGKRRADLDPEDLRRIKRAAKEGKGGYR